MAETLSSAPLQPARASGAVVASQTLTVSTSAVEFTDFAEPYTEYVVFDVVTSPVRVRWDGTDPTATVGHKLLPGTSYLWTAKMFNAAKFIRDTSASTDATLFASPLHS